MRDKARNAHLGDFVQFVYGKGLPACDRKPGAVPVYGSGGIVDTHNQALVQGPGVVVGRKGTIGSVYWADRDFYPIDTTYYVVPKTEDTRQRYIYYLLKTLPLARMNTDAAVPGLNRSNALQLKVSIPSLPTQDRIGDILSAYDDLIENNRRRIHLLEQAARLLYKEWFVHLRFPGYEHTPITDGVPEGWERSAFGDVVENFDKFRVPLSVLEREKRPGAYPYYGAAGILSHIDEFIFDGRFLLIGEDGTVVTYSGSAMLQFVQGRFWVSNHAHVVQGNIVTSEFLYCFLSNYSIQPHITGVAQPKLSQKNLNRIGLLIPTMQLRSLFQEATEPFIQQVFTLKSQIEQLAQARDLLLPRLMNGTVGRGMTELETANG